MKSIRRDDLSRLRFPLGAHVLEVVSVREPCQVQEHFPGQDCVHLEHLRDFAHSHGKEEPVLVHCSRQVDCHLAGQLLEYAGFEQVFVYEGELRDLKPHGWRAAEPERPLTAPDTSLWGTAAQRLEVPGYAGPFAGQAQETALAEEDLSWSRAGGEIEPFFVELSEEEWQRQLARETPPPEAGFEHLPPWVS